MKVFLRLAWPCAALLSFACSAPKPQSQSFTISLSARTDEGEPLRGTKFITGNKPIGTSPASGTFSVRLRGTAGSTLPLSIRCADGYVSPEPGSVRLDLFSAQDTPIRFDATCKRKMRDVVVVVHAENGSDLPISIDGEIAGKTDKNGNAHVLVPIKRKKRSLVVSLDTSQRARLRPKNPRKVFELQGRDAVALFNQPLTRQEPKPAGPKAPQTPRGREQHRMTTD